MDLSLVNIWVCESSVQNGCRVSSQMTKSNNEWVIRAVI